MENPCVSILILNWNAADETVISINSAKQQTFTDFEIVLIDNGSTDDSVEKLSKISGVKFINAGVNSGFSGGVSRGLEQVNLSPGRFVLLLNNDAAMEKDALSILVSAMRSDPNLGVLGGTILNMHDDGVQFHGGGRINWLTGSSRSKKAGEPDFISGAFMLIRSEVLVDLGGMSKDYFMYWEDVDFSLKACAAGWKLGVCENAVVRHKAMGSTGSDSPLYDYYFTRSATHFFWKGAGRRRIIPIGVIACKKTIKRMFWGPKKNVKSVLRGVYDGFTG